MQSTHRAFDLAHLAHLELITPKPDESLNFFVNIMGMTESGREGDSVYLRGWDDYEFHTLKLTAGKFAEMRHMAFRTTSPEALQRRVAVLEKMGLGKGWSDGDLGHGPAYQFWSSDGHNMELYWETKWYEAPKELKPSLKNQAMRFPVDMFPVMFAIPRTSGWVAQWCEMLDDPDQKIARPRQIYLGHRTRDYVPIDKR